LFAENFSNITACPSMGGGCRSGIRSFFGGHYKILAHARRMD
jgi:hypothetical protein